MANARNIRTRIKSVKNTAQITKAMQMVASSKMKRAQQAAISGRPYAEQINKILVSIRHALDGEIIRELPAFEHREEKIPGVLLVTTDKGLCGPLNTNVIREALQFPEQTKFVSVGRKGKMALSRMKRNLIADFELKDNATVTQIKQVSQFMLDLYLKREIDSIKVIYPHFVNTLIQRPETAQILPIASLEEMLAGSRGAKVDKTPATAEELPLDYIYEPGAKDVLSRLLPFYIDFEIRELILDARASEHSARMVAMKTATDNAKQIVKDLTLEYNKARQSAITSQILEIATAQMSLG